MADVETAQRNYWWQMKDASERESFARQRRMDDEREINKLRFQTAQLELETATLLRDKARCEAEAASIVLARMKETLKHEQDNGG